MSLPRVGISACLLGQPVRWDGGDKGEAELTAALAPHVEWVSVCPEVELGMGVPRPPVRIVRGAAGALRLVDPANGTDWTRDMEAFAERRLRALASLGLCGYVVKSRSPSCALDDAPVCAAGDDSGRTAPGLYTAFLRARLPDLPVEDERRLRDLELRARWLERVRARHRLRAR